VYIIRSECVHTCTRQVQFVVRIRANRAQLAASIQKVKRETGSNAPSTKQHVEFLYPIATRPPPRQNKSV
jgi:hypothetical protein